MQKPTTKLEEAKSKLHKLIQPLPKNQFELINKALETAEQAHRYQERYEGGPYILHPIRVAITLINKLNIKDPSLIAAALLHDTVEDADLTLEQIEKEFGPKTAKIVKALTRDKDGENKKSKYQRKYKKYQKLLKESREVRAIKACDWLDNLQSMPQVPPQNGGREKFDRWEKEATTMYLPLAQSVDPQIAQEMLEAINYLRNCIKTGNGRTA